MGVVALGEVEHIAWRRFPLAHERAHVERLFGLPGYTRMRVLLGSLSDSIVAPVDRMEKPRPGIFDIGTKTPRPSRKHHVELMVSDRGGLMRRRTGAALLGAALACVALPGAAYADTLDAASSGNLADSVAINSMWVVVAAVLVIWMQAGFAFLEIGFSRAKNAGTVVPKILVNFSIAAILLLPRRLRVRVRQRRPHRDARVPAP